jgi:hypothetical protein
LTFLQNAGWRPDTLVWKDYQLLLEERENGKFPDLEWIRSVSPAVPLPTGTMTRYQRDNHVRLFRLGERNGREVLGDLMDDGHQTRSPGRRFAL